MAASRGAGPWRERSRPRAAAAVSGEYRYPRRMEDVRPRKVVVNDRMQRDYAYWLTEPEGERFDPDFRPELTPAQMLELGVFGGRYMTDCAAEFPEAWFAHARL